MSDKDHSADNASHLTSLTKERNDTRGPEKLLDSSIHRCHSSMFQRFIGTSPTTQSVARAVDSCHSLPLSMLELARNDTSKHGSADRACALFSYPSMDPSLSALCSRFIKHCTH
ncbi:hypothetical protein NC652_013243 [Populus alba x Populus x berolinensis]|nr:hypothetical protein NC652_013243 [Populus alba x Populus x berolinensis]